MNFKNFIIFTIMLLISPVMQSQEDAHNQIDNLVLTENTLGNLNLKKKMPLDESILKKAFGTAEILKEVAQQDGPDYFLYLINDNIMLSTPDLDNEILLDLYINKGSTTVDEYGVNVGMTYTELKEKRSNLKIYTEHYHIYLYKEGSNISYEMEITNYNGPDKDEYTLEDIKNSKVTYIIWK